MKDFSMEGGISPLPSDIRVSSLSSRTAALISVSFGFKKPPGSASAAAYGGSLRVTSRICPDWTTTLSTVTNVGGNGADVQMRLYSRTYSYSFRSHLKIGVKENLKSSSLASFGMYSEI